MVNLIIPPISDCFMPTLGVAQIAGYLKDSNVECRVFDASAELLNIIFMSKDAQPEILQKMLGDGSYTYKNIAACLNLFSLTHENLKITIDGFQTDFHWQDSDKLQEFIREETVFSDVLKKLSFIFDEDYDTDGYYGISVSYECQVIPSMLLARIIKEKKPKAKICIGGSLLYNYENDFYKMMYYSEWIDILIIGSGEEVWKYIGKGRMEDIYNLPGINSRIIGDKCIIDTREAESKPIIYKPDFSDINFTYYPSEEKAFPYMIKDRCYYGGCRFCNGDKIENQSIKKDVETAFENMWDIAENIGIYNVYIVDAALSPKDLRAISGLKAVGKIKWIANGRFEKALKDETLISQIAKNGCVMLRFGLESASQKVLDFMNKGTKISDAASILQLTAKYGIKNHVYLMFGYPGETKEDRKITIDFLEQNRANISSYSVSLFQPIPGTAVYQELLHETGEDENTYERMIEFIYKDEYNYAEIYKDISRLNQVLRGYAETNIEYYSANIFNQISSDDKKSEIKDLFIEKSELQKVWKKELILENNLWIYEKQQDKKVAEEKYIIVDLFKNEIVHLAVPPVVIDILKNNLVQSVEATAVESEMAEELEFILRDYIENKGDCCLGKKWRYFDVITPEKDVNKEISIQFSPENEL